MEKNISKDISINSLDPHISYQETNEPLNNNVFYNTSTNFRTNLYNKEFKNIKVDNDNSNNLGVSFNKKMTKEQIKNYISYLKENINSSYYANKELNDEYNKLLVKLRKINESITNNNQLFNEMSKSYEINLEKNKRNKNIYIEIIDQYQKNINDGENKNNNLNKIINSQENDIIKLINGNNKLTDDINYKKNVVKLLQNLIELKKCKQINIDLNKKKNELILKNDEVKKIKELKNKNDELSLDRDKLKNELLNKENDNIEILKFRNDLINKIDILSNKNQNIKNFIKKEDDDNNSIQKVIEEENKKRIEINKNLEEKTNQLMKIKNDINKLKIKNEKEISSLNKYIKELNLNNEKIKNDLDKRKKKGLEQKIILLKYNQEFKESLVYKNNLIKKIEEIKKENEQLKNRKSKIFNIKTIQNPKINNKKLKYNLTDPNLNSHNKNQSIKFKSKSLSFNNILFNKNNQPVINKSIEIASNPRSGKYIYRIDNNGKLLSFGIEIKKFVYINTSFIKGWKNFYSIYKENSEGSLLLNTLGGLFILTGDNYNQLFYYSQYKNMINLIKSFEYNYKYGGMLLTEDGNNLIILGGEYTNSVIMFNLKENEVLDLPNFINKRINSSYNIINDRYIITFFGKGNNTIEYLDLFNESQNTWNILNYKINSYEFKELYGHISFNIDNNIIIITGGKDNDNIIIFYFKEKFLDITGIKVDNSQEIIFDKEKCFNIIEEKNKKEIIGMDNEGNTHCFNDDFNYTIFILN